MSDSAVRWMLRRGLTVKREMAVPWGICDLVGVELDPAKEKRRISLGQIRAIGRPIRLHILSRIPETESGRSITLTKLEKDFSKYLSSESLLREIQALIRNKFVKSPRKGHFQKLNRWAPLHLQIVAVELKLSRLSEALSQASANRAFATHSYVALPGPLASRALTGVKRELFRDLGVGLLAVSNDSCRELIKPRSRGANHDDIVQSHVVERFWRTRGN